MITNERQYRMAKTWIERFEQAIAAKDAPNTAHIPETIKRVMHADYQDTIDALREDVTAYEALRMGQGGPIIVRTLDALPDVLIQARIAAGLTQKQLAEQLELKEQQVQRYEQTRYASASWTRLLEVATVLGVRLIDPAHLEIAPFRLNDGATERTAELATTQS